MDGRSGGADSYPEAALGYRCTRSQCRASRHISGVYACPTPGAEQPAEVIGPAVALIEVLLEGVDCPHTVGWGTLILVARQCQQRTRCNQADFGKAGHKHTAGIMWDLSEVTEVVFAPEDAVDGGQEHLAGPLFGDEPGRTGAGRTDAVQGFVVHG